MTQEEIKAMVEAAEKLVVNNKTTQATVQQCNFRQAGQLSGEQVRTLTTLHEGFARSLSTSIAGYLRTSFEVAMTPLAQLQFSELLTQIPTPTYLASLNLPQLQAVALLQIDHSVVFPLIDLLLGGTGNTEVPSREVSEIEEGIMKDITATICRELELTWQHLGVSVNFDQRQPCSEMQSLLPPREKTLVFSFDIALSEIQGKMKLIIPGSVSNTMLRKLSKDWLHSKSKSEKSDDRLRKKLLNCKFSTELGIPRIKTEVHQLIGLAPGSILNLRVPLKTPAVLMVAGSESFESSAVRNGKFRAAQIMKRVTPQVEGKKN